MKEDKPALYLENMQGVNGLKAVGDDLMIASGKTFLKADKQKKLTTIAELPQAGDGIEPVGNGDYIVSSWGGYVFYVSAGGTVETLLETHAQKSQTADIGFDAATKTVYVPTFLQAGLTVNTSCKRGVLPPLPLKGRFLRDVSPQTLLHSSFLCYLEPCRKIYIALSQFTLSLVYPEQSRREGKYSIRLHPLFLMSIQDNAVSLAGDTAEI